jgi:PAS domain S-box-containing protein
MVLLDAERRHVEVNGAYLKLLGYRREELLGRPMWEFVIGGPLHTPAEWKRALAKTRFSGEARIRRADGREMGVQWAATVEVVTGQRLVLVVALSTSRWGRSFRRVVSLVEGPSALTEREREVVQLMALGSTGPEIADELGISHDTVRTHARNAMTKVGARSRAHLVAKSLGEGLMWQ